MIDVKYTNQYGSYILRAKSENGEKAYRIAICRANCLFAEMYFYSENGESKADLYSFKLDIKAFKNALKNGVYDLCDNFVFNAEELDGAGIWGVVKALVNAGKSVSIIQPKDRIN